MNFEDEARIKFLRLLGFSKDDLEKKVAASCYPSHICTCDSSCLSWWSILFAQISKCLGRSFQHNGHGVDAKDLAEKMQRLSTEVCTHTQTKKKEVFCMSSFCRPCLVWTILFLFFQRTDEAADARTSGSVSPADFFSHTPQENSNFQIPVSCGKNPSINYVIKTSYLWKVILPVTTVCVLLLKIPTVW